MTKKERKRLDRLLTVHIDALGAWLLLKALCAHLGQGDHDEVEGHVLGVIAQDLCDNLNREGLICEDGATDKLAQYVGLKYPAWLKAVK